MDARHGSGAGVGCHRAPGASTPSGSWVSGSGARPGSRSRCETRVSSRISGGPSPTSAAPDNVGSPYCVRRYVVDKHLGGPTGTGGGPRESRQARTASDPRFRAEPCGPGPPVGVRASRILRPGRRRTTPATTPRPSSPAGGKVFARGRDPYFPAWPDVLQLNAFDPGLRQAVIETLSEIAGQCDGIRCDMAMLMLNAIFERTWGARAGARPATDYWTTVIAAIKARHPEFRFIAEAYWDLEWELQQQGFDLLLRQEALRPDGARGRRERAPAPPGRSFLPGQDGPVHREPRRAQGRGRRSRPARGARPPWRSSPSPGRSCCTRGSSKAGR